MNRIGVCDIQAFNVPEFEPKEVTIFGGPNEVHHFLFKSSKSFNELHPDLRKQAGFLRFNKHGLRFDDGFIPQYEIKSLLRRCIINRFERIYVKGAVKMEYLRTIFTNDDNIQIINLESCYDVPNIIKEIPIYCIHHDTFNHPVICSLYNSKMLFDFLVR